MLQIARSIVVLPAPLAPSKAVIPPRSTMRSILCNDRRLPVGDAELAHFEQRRHAAVPR